MLQALALLLTCQLAGEVLARALAVALPGPVIGMALLFAGLAVRGAVPEPLRACAQGLLQHLSLLFVPAGVGIMLHIARLREEWAAILVALVLSTLLTLIVSGFVFRLVARLVERGGDRFE